MSQKKREGAAITQFLLIRIFTTLEYPQVLLSQSKIRCMSGTNPGCVTEVSVV